uniref:Uncharacterized protein n=1 Tax=Anguilla anguilla TaxID=7936 RepID=A0A0E9SSU8_ANGAN
MLKVSINFRSFPGCSSRLSAAFLNISLKC